MKKVTMIILSLFFVFQAVLLSAQSPQSINCTDGHRATCTAMEADYLWVGSEGGLLRINVFTQERTFYNICNSGLPSNIIYCIAIDNLGVKWISTEMGVVCFDGSNWTPVHVSLSSGYSGILTRIKAIGFGVNGVKWFMGLYSLYRFDGETWEERLMYGIMDYRSMKVDGQGNVWFLGRNSSDYYQYRLYRYNGTDLEIINTHTSGMLANYAASINVDESGRLWVCHCIHYDYNGEVDFVGGLSCFDGTTWTTYYSETSLLPILGSYAIAFNDLGTAWIGSFGQLTSFDGTNWASYSIPDSVNVGYSTFNVDILGRLWMSAYSPSENEGLAIFDGAVWTTLAISNSGLRTNILKGAFRDSEGNMWFGSYKGLHKYDGNTWINYNTNNSLIPANDVNCIAEDAQGIFWIGIGNRLFRFDGTNWAERLYYNSTINDIAIDSQGMKWYAVNDSQYGGLIWDDGFLLDLVNLQSTGIPSNRINSITIDADDVLWLSCNDNNYQGCGLTYFDGENSMTFDTSNSPLPSNNISSIVVDSQNAKWISTDNGLACLDNFEWTIYNAPNSLMTSNSFGAMTVDSNDKLWMLLVLDSWGYYYDNKLVSFDGDTWQIHDNVAESLYKVNWLFPYSDSSILMGSSNYAIGMIKYSENGFVNNTDFVEKPNASFSLTNYPNPFTASTNISFVINKATPVELKVFNLKGQLVKTLYNNVLSKGQQQLSWDGTDNDNRSTAQGIYLYRLSTPEGSSIRKLIRLK
ncbi:MAG: two-component regulator propeller domain-containing protein [Candidatus Cloacimonetes bacterium]|nr:two-component regulator propeller domain-containing protein [Candidatus Cloacimonadota bacterium]